MYHLLSPSRPARRLAVVLAAVLALLGGPLLGTAAASASASTAADAVPQSRPETQHAYGGPARGGYLALGDSVPFGYRPPAVTPPTDYLDPDNFVGHPELVARRLQVRLTNATCPGETTASMIRVGAQSNGCQNSVGSPVGYRTAYPLHTDYQGTQLDFAVRHLRHHRHTRLVSVMVGANDLLVCQRTTPDACTGSSFAATVAQVQQNLDSILAAVRGAPYRHRLVVVGYYSPDYADAARTGIIQALNAALARAAAAHRAVVADGFTAFRSATAAYGGDSCAAGLLIALPTGGCDSHPTAAGQRLLARAVLQAVRP
jgi:lysophospholipase L1-like esterase